MVVEIYWHPRCRPGKAPHALAVHVTYGMGADVHAWESVTAFGASGLDASPLSIFEIIAIACEEAETAAALMMASTQGRLMAQSARVH